MKWIVFTLVLCGVSVALGEKEKCVPKSTFLAEDGCNTCRCSDNGQQYSCTKKFCVDNPERPQSDEPFACEPKSRYQPDACNWCTCSDDGRTAMCTLMACLTKEDLHKVSKRETPTSCTPGARWQPDSCNWCTCAENGQNSVCTLKACIEGGPEAEVCLPGTSFLASDGCNTCLCNDDGLSASCTRKVCQDAKKPTPYRRKRDAEECEPGTSFKSDDGCNDCFCTPSRMKACTRKVCSEEPKLTPLNTFPRIRRDDQECEPGTSFKSDDGCNDCFCTPNGKKVCTRNACEEQQQQPKLTLLRRRRNADDEKCKSGATSFDSEDGCNTCFCAPSGVAVCTRKDCSQELKPTPYRRRRDSGN